MPLPTFFARHVAFSIAVPLTNLVVSGVTKVTPMEDQSPAEVGASNKKIALSIARTIGEGIESQTKKFLRWSAKDVPEVEAGRLFAHRVQTGFGEFGASGRRGLRNTTEGIRDMVLEAKPLKGGLFE